jgi:lipoate-protein ligase A
MIVTVEKMYRGEVVISIQQSVNNLEDYVSFLDDCGITESVENLTEDLSNVLAEPVYRIPLEA